MATQKSSGFFTYKNKKIITIILLLGTLVMPLVGVVGVVLMWLWMKWKTWAKLLITAPFIFIFILGPALVTTYIFVSRPVQIVGSAMAPNYTNGQYYITNVLHEEEKINRGDVVIFRVPGKEADYIKRVIALPNERVMIQNGQVYVNGQALDESSYSITNQTNTLSEGIMTEGEEITIPANHYFVLGDNRPRSQDSRTFGTIPESNITAIVGSCYWKCWE